MYLFRANVYCGPLHNNVTDCGGASSHIISPHLPPMTFLTRRLTSAAASLLPRHLLHNIYLPRCLTSRDVSCTTCPPHDISHVTYLLFTSLLVTSPCYVSRVTSLLSRHLSLLRLSCNIMSLVQHLSLRRLSYNVSSHLSHLP